MKGREDATRCVSVVRCAPTCLRLTVGRGARQGDSYVVQERDRDTGSDDSCVYYCLNFRETTGQPSCLASHTRLDALWNVQRTLFQTKLEERGNDPLTFFADCDCFL